jgi:soluble lytic murein transglycosylase-like protein
MRVCIIAGCLLSAGSGWLNAAGPSGGASVRSVVRTDPQRRLVRQVALVPAPGSTRNDALAELGMSRADIDKLIHRLAAENQLDPALVQAVVRVESDYDPFAVSPKGARGLMQLREPTLRRELERAGLPHLDLHDPAANVVAGVRYLRRLLDAFGREEVALMAYNAGPNRILGYLREGEIPERFQAYPRRVQAVHRKLRRNVVAPVPPLAVASAREAVPR